MEKDFRLFVKNLPINIEEAKVQDLLGQHVTVKKVDLKEKKDLDDKLHKFAFVNVTATDKQLYDCFGALNGERIDGFEISVDVAKESFLERLKREREESSQAKKKPVDFTPISEYVKPNLPNSSSAVSQTNHKKFSELDFSTDIHFKDVKPKKRKMESKDVQEQEKVEQIIETEQLEKSLELQTEEPFKNKAEPKRKIKLKIHNDFVQVQNNDQSNKSNNLEATQKSEISESERKRQMSLKQKKSVFKAQEQAIRKALRSVDTNKSNNKIVFDDDIDVKHFENLKVKSDTDKKKALFDSDDEGGEQEKIEWNEQELEAKSQINQKLMKLQAKIGYDKRFVLDERFIEDESEEIRNEGHQEQPENTEESTVTDEKKWQLEILKDVLGETTKAPIVDPKDTAKKKSKMIRYDPTASNHQDFEINIEKPKKEKPVKKKKEVVERVDEPVPEVSKEIFFNVGDLAIGTSSGGFSLLKSNNDDGAVNGDVHKIESSSGFKFNFNAQPTKDDESKMSKKDKSSMFNLGTKSPFKYNSSDDEGDNEQAVENGVATESNKFDFVLAPQENNFVFFVDNDPRFKEAVDFFTKPVLQDEGDFKIKRRGLKEIVRGKIRNNMKKKVPWNKKKIRNVKKK